MSEPAPQRSSWIEANTTEKRADDSPTISPSSIADRPPRSEPSRVFNPDAERRVRKKIDRMILPIVCLLYLFCFIDRSSIGNARLAGMEEDLQMQGNDYNATLSIFYISYIIFEIPSNILCKIIGPGWYLPLLTILFGACSFANAFVKSIPQAMAVRFLLGVFEAGMLPGIAYYLSRWYRRSELTFRLACYIATAPLAGAFGALLASGILTMDKFAAVRSWRMIFAIEGIVTMALGLVALPLLTDSPATACWLTPDEKELAEERIRSERVGQSKILDKIDKAKLGKGITSPVTLSLSAVFFFNGFTVSGFSIFAPTIIRTLFTEKTTIQQQLLTAPPYVLGTICTLVLPLLSWKMETRQVFLVAGTPTTICGYIIFLATENYVARYFATFLIAATIFSYGAFCNAQASANIATDTARTSAIGLVTLLGHLGGLVAMWSFLPADGPNYPIGNGLNLAGQGSKLAIAVAMLFWMKRDNRLREERYEEAEARLREMSESEIENMDWQHPGFRWQI